ncbi:cytochrome P450 [Streptomyces thinghirensis]|nr:cytochrome P450 [Streptomyces thinghirensis]
MDELLRYDSPLQSSRRITLESTKFSGVEIPPGAMVVAAPPPRTATPHAGRGRGHAAPGPRRGPAPTWRSARLAPLPRRGPGPSGGEHHPSSGCSSGSRTSPRPVT